MRQQIERLPVARDAALLDEDGPRDVTADHVALGGAEQVRVALVGEDREEGFLVRNLAPQRVGDAHRALFVRGDERTALLLPRDDVVDQHAAIDEVDAAPAGRQSGRRGRVLEVAGVRDDRRDAERREGVAQNLELAEGRHLAPVDNRHQRRRRGPFPLAIAGHERVEQRFDRPIHARVEFLTEARGDRRLVEHLREPLAVARARRRFAVVFGELQRVWQHERVSPRRGARRRVAGIDPRQTGFRLAQRELREQIRTIDRHARNPLAERPQRLRRVADATFVAGVEEERPEERTERTSTEVQPPRLHPLGQRRAQCGRILGLQ